MRSTPRPEPLGELEATVMDVVWAARSSLTARDVHDALTGPRARAYTTIMTTMDRLYRKGLLLRQKDGLAWRYRPALGRAEFERALADRLAGQILEAHGDAGMAAFVDAAARVDDALLDRLAELIDRRRRGGA